MSKAPIARTVEKRSSAGDYCIAEILVALGITGNLRASEKLVREGRVRLNHQLVVLPFELWPGGRSALSLNGRRYTVA